MKKCISILLFLSLIAPITPTIAREFYDVQFPERVTLPGTDTELQLNGIGFRTKFFFKIYIGALYTETEVNTRDEVQALKGPVRVQMHFVYDEVEREKLVSAWNDGFKGNTTSEQLAELSGRIEKFNGLFKTARKGDVVLLDAIPGKGVRVTMNGENKGMIAGDDFCTALLDIWLGESPADEGLKEAMLNL